MPGFFGGQLTGALARGGALPSCAPLTHRQVRGVLPGNIGYADLGRLPAEPVDSMFERLKDTRAIVLEPPAERTRTRTPV